ncbi:hypothetical protein [Mycobacterium sp. E3298]|uniref:hypothetical protein n=1 Tax=Mycobacterium sp. E3298 TaxID=1856865 RepID=UPI0012E9B835|nr:hypothetical protein [Mycobacterium sp. E3298]
MQVRTKRAAAWLRMKVETAYSAPVRTAERVKRPRRPGLRRVPTASARVRGRRFRRPTGHRPKR